MAGTGNPFVVDDEYVPPSSDDVVPAVPEAQVPLSSAPRPGNASALQFTESTVATRTVSGSMAKPGMAGSSSLASLGGASTASSSQQQQPSNGGFFGGAGGGSSGSGGGSYPFYNIRRYRRYFDVDTTDVLWRLRDSVAGPFKGDFIAKTLDQPDLYGPFWVATTLIFVTAVAGNYATYLAWHQDPQKPEPRWYTDYSKISWSAFMFYGYVFALGMALFFALKWFKSAIELVNVWCIYGYSLTIFIPVSFLMVINLEPLRWGLMVLATALSGCFLVNNFRAVIFEAAPARALLMLGLMTGLHLALGMALKLYMFSYYG